MASDYVTVHVTRKETVVSVDIDPADVLIEASPHNVQWTFLTPNAAKVRIEWVGTVPFGSTSQANPPLGDWRTAQPTAQDGTFTYRAKYLDEQDRVIASGDFSVRKKLN